MYTQYTMINCGRQDTKAPLVIKFLVLEDKIIFGAFDWHRDLWVRYCSLFRHPAEPTPVFIGAGRVPAFPSKNPFNSRAWDWKSTHFNVETPRNMREEIYKMFCPIEKELRALLRP